MNISIAKQAVLLWAAALILCSVSGSYLLACVFPFATIATLAALTMMPRQAIALIIAVWAANQAVGFFILSFPWEAQAVGHGIAILAATFGAYAAAHLMVTRSKANNWVRGGAALVAAFVVNQIILRAYAQVGGGAENFSAEIITGVAINDALWFAGLGALYFLISKITGERALSGAAA